MFSFKLKQIADMRKTKKEENIDCSRVSVNIANEEGQTKEGRYGSQRHQNGLDS